MERLGDFLRNAREARGLSIEDMHRVTRITMLMLKALEDNHLEMLPAPVIARGFIRSYCKVVGINEARALDIFDQEIGPRDPDLVNRLHIGDSDRSMKWIFILAIIAVLIIGIILFIYSGWNPDAKRKLLPSVPEIRKKALPADQPKKGATRSPLPSLEQTPAPSEPQRELREIQQIPPSTSHSSAISEKSAPPAFSELEIPSPLHSSSSIDGTDESTKDKAQKSGTRHTIVIEADELTWLQREIDEDPPRDIILHPGDKILLHARERIRLYIGNAGGVRLIFNGKPIQQLGPSGKVVSIELPRYNEKPRN